MHFGALYMRPIPLHRNKNPLQTFSVNLLDMNLERSKNRNKTGTSQVGAISKAQKAQNIFFGEKLEIFEKKFLSENVAQYRKM